MRDLCVITGGAGGIGLAAAKIVGRDRMVVICDVSQNRLDVAANELTALGIRCETVVCDVTDRSSVSEVVDAATALGTVASVAHAAGVRPRMGTPERIMRVNPGSSSPDAGSRTHCTTTGCS
ncbi:SDR family NAD(P)-dependent oxidoreductase [Mycobacterium lentiflavum]|uniref:SDR family NAD(P)-dependent oxidoreductase n=1 Tax=Mycobacterium lentiflavum TaxID=141349 RepID=UPI000B8539D3